MTDDELREVATAMLAGTFYSTMDLSPDMALSVFVPITLGGRKIARELQRKKVAVIYGILGKHRTARMAVNNVPMFFSCGTLTAPEYARARALAQTMRATPVPADPPPRRSRSARGSRRSRR